MTSTDEPTSTSAQSAGFWKELESFQSPQLKDTASVPKNGDKAPSSPKLPLPDGRPTVIVFLRHCGCPFAEKTFKALTTLSSRVGEQVHFVAVSHSSASATERWIPQVGGTWGTDVVVDEGRDLYAQWGLGLTSAWHAMSPSVLYSAFRLGLNEGVWNRPTESGSRWQLSGAFAVDSEGIIRWAHISTAADDMPDLSEAVKALGYEPIAA